MPNEYVSSPLGVESTKDMWYGVKEYLNVTHLGYDGRIEGYISKKFDSSQGETKPSKFVLYDYQLGLPGWAAEQLVKRVHLVPSRAFVELLRDNQVDIFLETGFRQIGSDGVWFELTREDRGSNYTLTPLFESHDFVEIVGRDVAYDDHNNIRHPGVAVVKPDTESEANKVVVLRDAISVFLAESTPSK